MAFIALQSEFESSNAESVSDVYQYAPALAEDGPFDIVAVTRQLALNSLKNRGLYCELSDSTPLECEVFQKMEGFLLKSFPRH